jgi:hypothetical protein
MSEHTPKEKRIEPMSKRKPNDNTFQAHPGTLVLDSVVAADGTVLEPEEIDAARPFAAVHHSDPVSVAFAAAHVRQGKPWPPQTTPSTQAAVRALLASEREA